jgi:hypothetical protein
VKRVSKKGKRVHAQKVTNANGGEGTRFQASVNYKDGDVSRHGWKGVKKKGKKKRNLDQGGGVVTLAVEDACVVAKHVGIIRPTLFHQRTRCR